MRYPTTVRPVHMHCPATVHPWTYAKPALPPSMAVVTRATSNLAVHLNLRISINMTYEQDSH